MSLSVVAPYRGGCKYRERAWRWVRGRYRFIYPCWDLVEARAPAGPWVKALAVTPALERTDSELVVVTDADVWCDGLLDAVRAVEDGAPWAVPHRRVLRLTDEATRDVLAGGWPQDPELVQRPYDGVFGGGIVVARRETLLDVPLDPRYESWGQEDTSWGRALARLAGKPWRGTADLWHLFHPPQERLSRRWGSNQGKALHSRYVRASRDRVAMAALIEEAKDFTRNAHQQAVHPDPTESFV